MPKKKMHFEISERKMILRLFDVLLFYLFSMRLGIFRFRLSEAAVTNRYRTLFFVMYLSVFAAILKCIICRLQVVSFKFKSTLLTASTTVLVYLLTPVVSPQLPSADCRF
jgi:predicted neutral ceramidase superfamily lipid hydrolase